MADAAYAVTSFLGGELSDFASGRFDKPDYKISLNVCLNSFPVEVGPWVRRPGSQYASHTRGGAHARVLKFDFEQSQPYTLEFTDGYVRFRVGAQLVTNNDSQSVTSISTANPCVVTVTTSPATGKTVMFGNLGTSCPLLQNRQFLWTNASGTTGTLTDALTGATIDGSTLGVGSLAATATMVSIQELVTPYIGSSWAIDPGATIIRGVQAETTDILLSPSVAPRALTVVTEPSSIAYATFALAAATFNDGPYLDPFTNGVQALPASTTGLIQLTLQFPAYSSTISYSTGDFVTSSSVNYESLIDQNVGNTPASHSSDWKAVDASVAINNGQGFLGTDIGRLIRLLSEPVLWVATGTYSTGSVITYNPTGLPGQGTYWQALTSVSAGKVPGADTTNWEVVAPGAALPSVGTFTSPVAAAGPAQWTWGKIVSLLTEISGTVMGVVNIGTMTANGGLAAAFNGTVSQPLASSAAQTTSGPVGVGVYTLNSFVGQNYGGTSASNYAIDHVTIWPPSDWAFGEIFATSGNLQANWLMTFVLYGSNSSPSVYNNGTLLGSTSITISGTFNQGVAAPLGTAPLTIQSSDKVTAYAYVWVAVESSLDITSFSGTPLPSMEIFNYIAQCQFFQAGGSATSAAGCTVEILGPPLLYTAPIITWRLGVYSNTTGWPSCGCYSDGRLWLGGAVANRFDSSTSNGIVGGTVNFAPTDQYGNVLNSSGISLTLNSDSVNPILWMEPDQQGILIGTLAREFLLFAPGQGGFAPNNIDARISTKVGCANVPPMRTEHTLAFVQRSGFKLMEYFPDVFNGKFTAPNLADKAQHIPRTGILELAYQRGATPIIWGRCTDGTWFGITYKRDTLMTSQGPTYYAWHRHSLGSGRAVESICGGPSVTGTLDALTMVTSNNFTQRSGIHWVEILTDTMDELTPLASSWFLDGAVVPSSTVSTNTGGVGYGGLTLNGLWHLNGQSVTAFAGGLDCGDYVVSNGSIFVPYGDGISAGTGGGLFTAAFAAGIPANQIIIGFTYNSDGQLVRPQMPQEVGTRTGPALGKRRRFHKAGILFNNLAMGNVRNQSALSIGRDFTHLKPVIISPEVVPNQPRMTPGQVFSGVWMDTVSDESGYDGMVAFRISRPLPGNVIVIEPMLAGQD
jgi:hypothetical protein